VKDASRAAPESGTNRTEAEQVAEILKAVAHPLRLRIVAVLRDEEVHVDAFG
jgi:DNA-binding transcriptional ArsR family regulator